MKIKIAALTIAYNERQYIKACIANWEGVIDKHLVLVSTSPWNGSPVEDDGTYRAAMSTNAEVKLGEWKTEEDQRTWGLARLYDYDMVLMIDPDEFFTKVEQNKLLDVISKTDKPLVQGKNVITYWKDMDHVLDPPDMNGMILAVDPKVAYAYEHRQFKYFADNRDYISDREIADITYHHMSWAKSDDKVKEKIQSFSHADDIKPNWYNDIWSKWEEGSKMQVKACGLELSNVIYKPAPNEIKALISNNR